MSEIEKYEPEQLRRLAGEYAESGMFSDARKTEQALVKIYAGAELGLAPFQSMSGVHIIQGKPVVGAGLLAAILDRDPAYDYTVKWEGTAEQPTACVVTVLKNDKERGQSRFSLEDAQRAGLNGGNWVKYPSAMLFARAMSQAVRWYAPGATGTSVYVEGELAPDPQPRADIINVTPNVTGYVAPDDTLDDVPFEDSSENAAPAASYPAESPPDSGQTAAEPAGTASPGGLIIETLQDAQSLINALDGPQLGVMKSMLGINQKTTRRLLAEALLEQRYEWDSHDVLAEMAGWA